MAEPPKEARSWVSSRADAPDARTRLIDELKRRRDVSDLHRRITRTYDGPSA
jgi:hypothetical protein